MTGQAVSNLNTISCEKEGRGFVLVIFISNEYSQLSCILFSVLRNIRDMIITDILGRGIPRIFSSHKNIWMLSSYILNFYLVYNK